MLLTAERASIAWIQAESLGLAMARPLQRHGTEVTAMKTKQTEKPTQIETIETTKLDAVTGGCAACGSANCRLRQQQQQQDAQQ